MITEDSNSAAVIARDYVEAAELADRGAAPNPDRLLAKAQVYATLAVVEALEGLQGEPPVFGRD